MEAPLAQSAAVFAVTVPLRETTPRCRTQDTYVHQISLSVLGWWRRTGGSPHDLFTRVCFTGPCTGLRRRGYVDDRCSKLKVQTCRRPGWTTSGVQVYPGYSRRCAGCTASFRSQYVYPCIWASTIFSPSAFSFDIKISSAACVPSVATRPSTQWPIQRITKPHRITEIHRRGKNLDRRLTQGMATG
jgi:hypothetical protein